MQQPSGNMDDTGFFSVQVISQALILWNLELIPLYSSDEYARKSREDPTHVSVYIFNMESHWFCIRRFTSTNENFTSEGASAPPTSWFNLNSLLSRPEFMSSLYLTEYLKQMREEGYSIFVVRGELPECPADTSPPRLRSAASAAIRTPIVDLTKSKSNSSVSDNDEEMQRAIQLSLETAGLSPHTFDFAKAGASASTSSGSNIHTTASDSDSELETALRLSMECFGNRETEAVAPRITQPLSASELRNKRMAYFDNIK